MTLQEHRDQQIATLGKSPAAGAGNLCQEAVDVQASKESDALQGMLAAEDGREQAQVLFGDRAATRASLSMNPGSALGCRWGGWRGIARPGGVHRGALFEQTGWADGRIALIRGLI